MPAAMEFEHPEGRAVELFENIAVRKVLATFVTSNRNGPTEGVELNACKEPRAQSMSGRKCDGASR